MFYFSLLYAKKETFIKILPSALINFTVSISRTYSFRLNIDYNALKDQMNCAESSQLKIKTHSVDQHNK